jgi:hypothetical protein
MKEYIIAGVVLPGIYLILLFIKNKHFKKYRYYPLVTNISALMIFAGLFWEIFRGSTELNGYIIFCVLLLLYFIYNIIREIILLQKNV